jgi:hypothetical protein
MTLLCLRSFRAQKQKLFWLFHYIIGQFTSDNKINARFEKFILFLWFSMLKRGWRIVVIRVIRNVTSESDFLTLPSLKNERRRKQQKNVPWPSLQSGWRALEEGGLWVHMGHNPHSPAAQELVKTVHLLSFFCTSV